MWLPGGTGIWPAFWVNGQTWPDGGEIDVVEAYGSNRSEYHYHYAGCGGNCNPGGGITIESATGGWHTYAIDWEPGAITWYYDGQRVWQYTTGVVSGSMYLILNLSVFYENADVPATMKVDYVRVWQKDRPDVTPAATR